MDLPAAARPRSRGACNEMGFGLQATGYGRRRRGHGGDASGERYKPPRDGGAETEKEKNTTPCLCVSVARHQWKLCDEELRAGGHDRSTGRDGAGPIAGHPRGAGGDRGGGGPADAGGPEAEPDVVGQPHADDRRAAPDARRGRMAARPVPPAGARQHRAACGGSDDAVGAGSRAAAGGVGARGGGPVARVATQRGDHERSVDGGAPDARAARLARHRGRDPEARRQHRSGRGGTLRESLEALVRVDPASAEAALPASQTPPPTSIAARPDIREATARVALADAKIEQARREGRADLSLVANYGREGYGFDQRGFDSAGRLVPVAGNFHSVEIGASLMLPFRNRNQGAVAAAEAERSGEQEMLAARQLVAQAEIDAAVVRDREAQRAVDIYATSLRDLARQNVDVQLEAYDLGRTPLSDLLAEQRRYLDVEAAYTSMLARAYDARVALRRARGESR